MNLKYILAYPIARVPTGGGNGSEDKIASNEGNPSFSPAEEVQLTKHSQKVFPMVSRRPNPFGYVLSISTVLLRV